MKKSSTVIRSVIFALTLCLTGCVGYAHHANPGDETAYYSGYVAQPYSAPAVVVPFARPHYWHAPPPRHHRHHRERDRRDRHHHRH